MHFQTSTGMLSDSCALTQYHFFRLKIWKKSRTVTASSFKFLYTCEPWSLKWGILSIICHCNCGFSTLGLLSYVGPKDEVENYISFLTFLNLELLKRKRNEWFPMIWTWWYMDLIYHLWLRSDYTRGEVSLFFVREWVVLMRGSTRKGGRCLL